MKGLTLVEILVATLILSIILAALFIVLSTGQRAWFTGDVAIELRDQVVRAITTMNDEISETGTSKVNIATGDSSNSLTFWIPYDEDGDTYIIDTSGAIEWTGPITYSLNASNQIIRSFAGSNSVLGNDVVSLLFTRTLERIIQVDITAQKTPRTGEQIQDIEQAVIKIRN